MKQKFSIAMSFAVILAMLLTSLALADQVTNNLDVSVDADYEVMSLNVDGPTGSTVLSIIEQNGDGKNGCNLQGSNKHLTVSVTSSDTSVAAVSPDTITFSDCNDTTGNTVTVTPVGQGSAYITVGLVSVTTNTAGVTSDSFDMAPGSFKVNVAAPANTAPQVEVTGVTHGETYEYGTVPTAGCSVQDAEDGNSTFAASLSPIIGSLASYGLGTQTATCSYTDLGGLNTTVEATYEIVDTTAPDISFVGQTPTANGNGWNNTDVTLEWICSDIVGVVDATVSQTLTAEGANQSATGTCEDVAGNTVSDMQNGINIDKTPPTASASALPAANANGWNNTDVTVSFSGTDALSSIDSCSANQVFGEGANQSASGTCVDKAGNVSAPATVIGINVDKTAPSISLVGGPADGGTYYYGFVPAASTCLANDVLSGLDGACSVSGYSNAIGTHTVSASATDKAGNTASVSAAYTVSAWTLKGFYAPVDMNGVFNVVKGGSTAPLKFEVFAGPTELTSTSVVTSFVQTKIACDGTLPADDIEFVTTGGTSLRYDATAGQFVQNWQTPKLPGQCYRVTMTTQDGSFLIAFFKLK